MLDLRPRHLALLQDLIAQYLPPDVVVWAYGSRVNDDAYDDSDLDLVLRTPDLNELPYAPVCKFREGLAESNLPILVDVHDWAQLPASFQERILARYAIVQPARLMDNAT